MPPDLSCWGALAGVAEVGLLVAAAHALLIRRGASVAEGFAIAVTLALASLSATIQLAFLLALPELSLVLEAVLVAVALWVVVIARHHLSCGAARLWALARSRPILASLVATIWAYLGALALFLPPNNPDSLRYHLPRVLLFQQERSLFLPTPEATLAPLSTFPVGSDILAHLFLRLGTDYGLGVFTWLSYLAVVAGAYALARPQASQNVALTAALVVASLTELVYMSTAIGKNDIVMTLAAVTCLVVGHRLLAAPDGWDVLFLVVALAFGVATKTQFLAFALPFVTLYGIEIWRLHGTETVKALLSVPRRWVLLTALFTVVLSQSWLFIYNHRTLGSWSGHPEFTHFVAQHDGWKGTAANLTRYAFESLDVTKVGDLMVAKATGVSAAQWLERAYDDVFGPIFDGAGASSEFTIKISIDESKAWFGPLGFLLVLPSLLYAIWHGPRSLRMIAWVLLGYTAIIAWQIEWTMWHGRYFAPVFVGAASCLAGLLRRWETKRFAFRALQGVSVCLLLYAAIFNQAKQIVPLTLDRDLFVEGLTSDNVWATTDWGRDRIANSGSPSGLEFITGQLEDSETVGVLLRDNARFYYYPLHLPSVRFRILPRDVVSDLFVEPGEARGLDAILCIGLDECPDLLVDGGKNAHCHRIDGRFNDACVLRLDSKRDGGQRVPGASLQNHPGSLRR